MEPANPFLFAAFALVLVATLVNGATTRSVSTPSSDVPTSEKTPSSSSAPNKASPAASSSVSDANLDAALADNRYLMRQLKCALGEAPCDPVGKRLKSLAPFVLRGACPKCTPGETRQIQKTLAHIQRTFPKEWGRLVQAYAG